jgi:hypothetical protein
MTLLTDKIDLVLSAPIDVVRRFGLIGAQLQGAKLSGYNLGGVNFTNANLRGADLSYANLRGALFCAADLSRADLYMADCTGADFSAADMTMTYGKGTLFIDGTMIRTMLRRVTYKNCFFTNTDLEGADMAGGLFVGSCFDGANTKGIQNLTGPHAAVFKWYMRVGGGPPRYEPADDYIEMTTSVTGTLSFQENAARRSLT